MDRSIEEVGLFTNSFLSSRSIQEVGLFKRSVLSSAYGKLSIVSLHQIVQFCSMWSTYGII